MMKNKKHIISVFISIMFVVMGVIWGGCGGSTDKFSGIWVSPVGYGDNYYHADYNKLAMEELHIDKNGSSNEYHVVAKYYLWGVEKKAEHKPDMSFTGVNPKDSDTLNLPQDQLSLVYNEKDKKLHINAGGVETTYVKVKDEKALDAIKDRIAKFVDDHMDEMKRVQEARNGSIHFKSNAEVSDQEEQAAIEVMKSIRDEVNQHDFINGK